MKHGLLAFQVDNKNFAVLIFTNDF